MSKYVLDKAYALICNIIDSLEEDCQKANKKANLSSKKNIALTIGKVMDVMHKINKVGYTNTEIDINEEDKRIIENFIEKHKESLK